MAYELKNAEEAVKALERTARNLIDGNVPLITREACESLSEVQRLRAELAQAEADCCAVVLKAFEELERDWNNEEIASAFMKQ